MDQGERMHNTHTNLIPSSSCSPFIFWNLNLPFCLYFSPCWAQTMAVQATSGPLRGSVLTSHKFPAPSPGRTVGTQQGHIHLNGAEPTCKLFWRTHLHVISSSQCTYVRPPWERSGIPLPSPQPCHKQDVETGCIHLSSRGHGLTWISQQTCRPHQQFSVNLLCSKGGFVTAQPAGFQGLLLQTKMSREGPTLSRTSPQNQRRQRPCFRGCPWGKEPEPFFSNPVFSNERISYWGTGWRSPAGT